MYKDFFVPSPILIVAVFLLFILGSIVFHYFIYPVNWEALLLFLVGLLAAIISYTSFTQTHEIEKLRAFQELFTGFNQRYNGLNNELNRIHKQCSQGIAILTEEDRNILYDYFNLCGEEYYYYKNGYIFPEVWKAWCHGIHYFLQCPKINEVWMEEEKTQAPSYYGLTFQVIQDALSK